jgi:hypothetical protein
MPFDFAALDTDFADAKAPENNNEEVPNGKYAAKIHKVEILETKTGVNKGKPRLSWQMIIEGGAHDGRFVFNSSQMASKENLAWLKKDLATCGVVLAKLSDLPSRLAELLDKRIMITVKNKPGANGQTMTNVYLDKLIAADSASPALKTDPDIGF